jgi:hypothetical protein
MKNVHHHCLAAFSGNNAANGAKPAASVASDSP